MAAIPAPPLVTWALANGVRYRLGLRLADGRAACEVAPSELRAALEDAGFVGVVVYVSPEQLPAGWPPGRADAWTEGTWARATKLPARIAFVDVIAVDRADAPVAVPSPTPTPRDVTAAKAPAVVHTGHIADVFYDRLADIERRRGWSALGMLMVMFSESGVNPAAWHPPAPDATGWVNPDHGASGLIQFVVLGTPGTKGAIDTLRGSGWTRGAAEFRKLAAEEQLPFVENYYAGWKLPSGAQAAQIYLVNYEPAKVAHGADPRYVLDREGEPYYAANAGAFDPERKGFIEVDDLRKRLARVCQGEVWNEHAARLAFAQSKSGGLGGFIASAVAVGSVLLAAAGGVAWWFARERDSRARGRRVTWA